MIRVESSENVIIIKFPYNPDYIAKLKPLKATDGILMENTGAFHILNLKVFC